ncbi:MAG: hypothetical protein KGM42_11325 [Hyphomicrobiales bacterium]|nr:hypothetical protein [Hyphomicrobiales bacterium]
MPQSFFKRSPAVLAFVCAAATTDPSAFAQQAQPVLKLQDANAFVESYLDQPPNASRGIIVGATIVGVRLEGPDMPFNPGAVRVRLGARPAGAKDALCLRVISRDGRYAARAQYSDEAPVPAPVVEFRTAYQQVLAAYSNRDVAAQAFRAPNCTGAGVAQFVASQLTPTLSGSALVIQIRAGEARVRAQLAQGANPVGDAVLCERYASGPTVGYTAQCEIKLPSGVKSGEYQIIIGETSSSGDIRTKSYPLALWLDG